MENYFCRYLLVMLFAKAIATNQHLVCKTVEDVFSDTTQYSSRDGTGRRHQQGIRGMPGERGPIGPPGLSGSPGMKGETGYVDYNNISKIVEAKVTEGLEAIVARLDELQRNMTDLCRENKAIANQTDELEKNVTDSRLNKERELMCGVPNLYYNGYCYRVAHLSKSKNLNLDSAIEVCRNIDFNIAVIHDRTQQEIVENFLRPNATIFSRINALEIWLDMTYDHATRMVRYRSGKYVEADDFLWYPTYPSSNSAYRYMMIAVRHSGSDGMINYRKNYNTHGVICEKKM